MSDLELAAVLTLALLAYRIVEALIAVRRADRHDRAVRYRDTYGWPVEAVRAPRRCYSPVRGSGFPGLSQAQSMTYVEEA